MLISFSGLDGAGKTTLINGLKRILEEKNYTVTVLTMYDDVAFYSLLRSLRDRVRGVCAAASDGTQGHERAYTSYMGDPRTDVSDKARVLVRLIYRVARSLTVRRAVLLLDLASLLLHRLCIEGIRKRVLVTDRYLYDILVDVVDQDGRHWGFVRWFTRLVPTPNAPVFVDVPAEQAFARKPEYPLDYLKWRARAYQKVFTWVHRSIVLDNNDLAATMAALKTAVTERLGVGKGGI